jgi:hypothetical protein
MDEKFTTLISLLDDPNPMVGANVLAELLKHQDELPDLIKELQESHDPVIRQRIHQLQVIATIRKQRHDFAQQARKNSLSLFDILLGIHLLWYDSDPPEEIIESWKKHIRAAKKFNPVSLNTLGRFMRKQEYTVIQPDQFRADHYCLGCVMDEKIGAELILCCLAAITAATFKLETRIGSSGKRYYVVDGDGNALSPGSDWKCTPLPANIKLFFWDRQKLVKQVLSMLFLYAVGSDSFRYINTIGSCLSEIATGKDDLDFLPYPYNKPTNPDPNQAAPETEPT